MRTWTLLAAWPWLLAALALGIGAPTPVYGFDCTITASCCSATSSCDQNQACVCTATCTTSEGSCSCTCSSAGGKGPKLESVADGGRAAVRSVLESLTEQTGMKFSARAWDADDVVDVSFGALTLEETLHAIGQQIHAVPVYRGTTGTVEFVSERSLRRKEFSRRAVPLRSEARACFSGGVDVNEALRAVAKRVRADVVIPRGLSGTVEGSFVEEKWPRLLTAIVAASGNFGRAEVSPKGLVQILP